MPSTKEEIKELKKEIKSQKEEIEEEKKEKFKAIKLASRGASSLKSETKKQTITAMVAAFGFLIALVWRDAIQAYVKDVVLSLSIEGPEKIILLYTAIITTLIAVLGILLITRWGKKEEKAN